MIFYRPYLQASKREILADYALPCAVLLLSFVGSFVFRDIPGKPIVKSKNLSVERIDHQHDDDFNDDDDDDETEFWYNFLHNSLNWLRLTTYSSQSTIQLTKWVLLTIWKSEKLFQDPLEGKMNLMLFFNAFQHSLDIVELMSLNFSIGSMNTLVFIFLFFLFTYFTKIFT